MTGTMSTSDNVNLGVGNCNLDWNWCPTPPPSYPLLPPFVPYYPLNPPAQVTVTYPVYLTDPKLIEELREQVKEIRRLTDEVRKLRRKMVEKEKTHAANAR